MTMVVSRNQRIFFRYEGERGAFLVLHHGLLGSHEDWYAAGYVEELAKEFRVVVLDARGHGRSDKPVEPETYAQALIAEDVIEIMNELGIRNSHFVGYGVGALVGFELLRRFPERMRIAILGGESALVTPAVQDVYRAEAESLKAMTLGEYLKALRDQGRVVRTAATVDEETERPAALALLTAVSAWEPAPAERIQVTSPLTLFAGAEDPALHRVDAARSGVSRARMVHFPGLGHERLFHERTQLLEEVLRLLKSGRREDGDNRPRGDGERTHGYGPERRGQPGRQDSQSYGNRWNDAREAGAHGTAAPGVADAPSPIPGAVLDARSDAASSVATTVGETHAPAATSGVTSPAEVGHAPDNPVSAEAAAWATQPETVAHVEHAARRARQCATGRTRR
jgi:pimeloyl-ACP methyl ester carboxylesterase